MKRNFKIAECIILLACTFFSTSCQKKGVVYIPVNPTEPPSVIDIQIKQPILPIYQPSEKQISSNIDLSKVPELKIDFTKYPTLDFDKLSKKPYKVVAETDQKIDMLHDRGDHFIQGDFIVVEFTCIGYGVSCIDKNTMKVLWKKPNFNLYGCTKDIVVCYIPTLEETDDSIYAFDIKTGKLKWKYDLQSWVDQWFGISSTSINDNEMIFTSYTQEQHYDINKKDGITFALDSKTGKELWRIPVAIFGFSLIEYGNMILYCDQKFNISAFDRKTGKVIWTNLEINKESKESLDFSILPLQNDKVLLYSLDRDLVTKYFVLNVNNGNIESKSLKFLSNEKTISIYYSGYKTINTSFSNNFAFFTLKIDSNFFLSKFDLLKMKEIWRIPTLESLYGDYLMHKIWILEEQNRIYLNISKETLDQEETKSTNQIPDGFYEIDFETGKILWRINHPAPVDSIIENGILFISSPYNDYENIGYIAAIDLNNHLIRWALNTKNDQLYTKKDGIPLIFQLRKNIGDGKLSDGPFIEFSPIDGSVLAYKNCYDLSDGQYRYGYDDENGKLYKMVVQK